MFNIMITLTFSTGETHGKKREKGHIGNKLNAQSAIKKFTVTTFHSITDLLTMYMERQKLFIYYILHRKDCHFQCLR